MSNESLPEKSPPAPSRITVVTLAGDDVQALEDTLAIARSIGDELLVVDAHTDDQILQTAQQEGAEVLDCPWQDDYAAARNAAHDNCQDGWIVWLEPGETMDLQAAVQLRQLLTEQRERRKAYMLLVENPPAVVGAASEQIGVVRVFPNNPAIRFMGRVRENAHRSLQDQGIAVEGLPFRIHRSVESSSGEAKARKARREIALAERAIREEGPQPRLLNCLGEAHDALGDASRSRAFSHQALEESHPGSSDMLEAYYGLLASLNADGSQSDEQLSLCLQALDVFPVDGQLLCAMGSYLQSRGRLDLASRSYLTAYEYGTVNPEVWHLPELREVAAACYALTLQLQQQEQQALEFLTQATAEIGDSRRLRRQLLELHVKLDQPDEAVRLADGVVDRPEDVEPMHDVIRGACLARRQRWSAARTHLESAYRKGCRDPLCMRWLTTALAATGAKLRAREVLRDWRATQPLAAEIPACAEAIEKHAAQRAHARQRRDVPASGAPAPTDLGGHPTSISPFSTPPSA